MRNIVLFDLPEVHCACLPITFTRAVSDVRVGYSYHKRKNGNIMCRATIRPLLPVIWR